MPAINNGTILVTGASGFLGCYIVEELQRKGFKVRAVVRDDKKGEYLQKHWPGTEYQIVKEMNEVSEGRALTHATRHSATGPPAH